MNNQGSKGIEWTHVFGPGTGRTLNPIGGCLHQCRFKMPDGELARCYAEAVAEGVAKAAYPNGFRAHYWHPERLYEPFREKEPRGIFIDSMSDLMGHWVSDGIIMDVLAMMHKADWHIYFLLTKNAPRLERFATMFPKNCWVGVSMPPSHFGDKALAPEAQRAYIYRALTALSVLRERGLTTWMSFEPLTYNVATTLYGWTFNTPHRLPLDWAVIGAASNGRAHYQPKTEWVSNLIAVLECPVFMKGNLEWSPHLEQFPEFPREEKNDALSADPG